jgi:hypothetical protein
MSLLEIYKGNKQQVLKMTIEQVATMAAAGSLKLLNDKSEGLTEFRDYLKIVNSDSLGEYARYCLDNKFTKSGEILQDVVNELGRRLEYFVENGRYQGVKNAIGFDGIWTDDNQRSIVVEVKTTDVFRIALDTIAGKYKKGLIEEGRISPSSSVLIVVGRTDTGELEAQVRGSKYSWDVRIIGVESLIQLVRIKEASDQQETIGKIRSLLMPQEYTRIDSLVDIVFIATNDVDSAQAEPDVEPISDRKNLQPKDITPGTTIDNVRNNIIAAIDNKDDVVLIKKTKAMYWSPNHDKRVACTISKRYDNQGSNKYWYAYHPSWNEFLGDGELSYIALGCVDLEYAFLLPLDVIRKALPYFNKTEKKDGSMYWHIKIIELEVGFFLQVPSPGENISLDEYKLQLKK